MKSVTLPLVLFSLALCNTAHADLFGWFRAAPRPVYYDSYSDYTDGMVISDSRILGSSITDGGIEYAGYTLGGGKAYSGEVWGDGCCEPSCGCGSGWLDHCRAFLDRCKPRFNFCGRRRWSACEPACGFDLGCGKEYACGWEPTCGCGKDYVADDCGCGWGHHGMRRGRLFGHRHAAGCGCGYDLPSDCGCSGGEWKAPMTPAPSGGSGDAAAPPEPPAPTPEPETTTTGDRQASLWVAPRTH